MDTGKYIVRTGQIKDGVIVDFRDDVIKLAKEKGRAVWNDPYATRTEPYWEEQPPRWWPALAPLALAERAKVFEDLTKEFAERETPPPAISTPDRKSVV